MNELYLQLSVFFAPLLAALAAGMWWLSWRADRAVDEHAIIAADAQIRLEELRWVLREVTAKGRKSDAGPRRVASPSRLANTAARIAGSAARSESTQA